MFPQITSAHTIISQVEDKMHRLESGSDRRHGLEFSDDQMHCLDSCADLKQMLDSGAGRLNTIYVTRQVKGVPQGANCCVGRSNLWKHLLHVISNAYQEPLKGNTEMLSEKYKYI